MKIKSVDLFSYDLPLVAPLILKGGTIQSRAGLILRITDDDGHVGWGEASPLPGFSREDLKQIRGELLLVKEALPDRITRDSDNVPAAIAEFIASIRIPLASSSLFSLESALLNLIAAARGASPVRLLSEQPQQEIQLNALITNDIDQIPEMAKRLISSGYKCVKLKVGDEDIDQDVARVKTLRESVGSSVRIRLDGNRSWTRDQASHFAGRVEAFDIEYIEEPFSSTDDIVRASEEFPLPVALDETLNQVRYIGGPDLPDAYAVVLKPTLLGGLRKITYVARKALQKQMKVILSSSFESSIGLTMLCHIASALGTPGAEMGLDTVKRFEINLHRDISPLRGPMIQVSELADYNHQLDTSLLRRVEG